jgi:hypothetical protein
MNLKAALFSGLALVMLTTVPATSERVQLEQSGGVYVLPVRINDAVTLPFVLDSGAAEVAIPADVFLTLFRTGTIDRNDFIGTGKYTLADGQQLRVIATLFTRWWWGTTS